MIRLPLAAAAVLAVVSAPAVGAPVNPATAPVQVTVQSVMPQPVTVRIVRASDGLGIGTLGPVTTGGGTAVFSWSGGRGPGGTGQPVADGVYRLEGLAADGVTVLPTTPAEVDVDMTAPAPVLTAPRLRIPLRTARPFPLRPGGSTEVRTIVRRPGSDEALVTGAWQPAGTSLELPRALRAKGVVGAVSITAEGRDAAGNIGTSDPVIWSVQPPGTATTVVTRIRTSKPLVAVTVDDGYGGPEAASMIRAARDAGVTITFCFNAINSAAWNASLRTAIREAVADGHLELCNHGYAHNTGKGTSESAGVSDLTRNRTWDEVGGIPTAPFYRPPYGAYGSGLLAAARDTGYRYVVLWDVDTNDWRGPSASVITQRAVGGARRGSIVLMHTKPNTAAAMPDILRGLKAKGLRPVGLGQLFSAGRPG